MHFGMKITDKTALTQVTRLNHNRKVATKVNCKCSASENIHMDIYQHLCTVKLFMAAMYTLSSGPGLILVAHRLTIMDLDSTRYTLQIAHLYTQYKTDDTCSIQEMRSNESSMYKNKSCSCYNISRRKIRYGDYGLCHTYNLNLL